MTIPFAQCHPYSCADSGIFVGGGGGGGSRSIIFFFSPQFILQYFKENLRKLSFFKVPEGVQHFPGGSNFFQGGGGSNCLFPIETHITCEFPGGSGPLSPLWIRTCLLFLYIYKLLFRLEGQGDLLTFV